MRPTDGAAHARVDTIANLDSGDLLDLISNAEMEATLAALDVGFHTDDEDEELESLLQSLPMDEMQDLSDAVSSVAKRPRPPSPKKKNVMQTKDAPPPTKRALCKYMRV